MQKANTGSSTNADSYLAGREAAAKAKVGLGGIKMAFVYAGADNDMDRVLQGIREELPGVPLIGNTSFTGVITPEGFISGERGFVALLEREEALLVHSQIDALALLAEEKTALYRALQRLSDDRVVMFARLGAKVTNENIRIVLASNPEALTAWEDVVALAEEAKERNRVNGQLITQRLQNNQQALTTLLAAAEHPQIYGPDGQSRPTAGSRHFGSV